MDILFKKFILINLLYNDTPYNSKICYNIILISIRMDILFKKFILNNSKFSLMSEYMETNGVIVKKVHCNEVTVTSLYPVIYEGE